MNDIFNDNFPVYILCFNKVQKSKARYLQIREQCSRGRIVLKPGSVGILGYSRRGTRQCVRPQKENITHRTLKTACGNLQMQAAPSPCHSPERCCESLGWWTCEWNALGDLKNQGQ